MKVHFTLIVFCTLLFSQIAWAESSVKQLKITIKNIKSQQGKIHVALFDRSENFLTEKWLTGKVLDPTGEEITIIFAALPEQDYAVAVYQDLDNDEKMNRNFFGSPTEPHGLSNNVKGVFGPPSFEEASFSLKAKQQIEIHLQ